MSRIRQQLTRLLVLTATLSLLFVPAANAYIDAGSTTVVFQSVVAALAAGGMFFKLYWRRLTALFGRGRDDSEAATGAPPAGTATGDDPTEVPDATVESR